MWLSRQAFEPTMIERLDAMYAANQCPDAIIVFVDAWTRYGGSQFLNSTSTGRYLDYLCDEVVAFIDATLSDDREPRPPRPDRQVVRRLRRDGRADAAAGRVRRARQPRRRRPVRGVLPARVPAGRAAPARRVRLGLGRVLRARASRPIRPSRAGSPCSRSTATPPAIRPTPTARAARASRSTPTAA